MQQREDAQQGLMRVSVTARRPAAEQLALLIYGKSLAGEPARFAGGQVPGGVGEDDLAAAGEAEELPQHASMSCTSASAQSCLPLSSMRNSARSRMVVHALSCVLASP